MIPYSKVSALRILSVALIATIPIGFSISNCGETIASPVAEESSTEHSSVVEIVPRTTKTEFKKVKEDFEEVTAPEIKKVNNDEKTESLKDAETFEEAEISEEAEPLKDEKTSEKAETSEEAEPLKDTETFEEAEISEKAESLKNEKTSEKAETSEEAEPSKDTETFEEAEISEEAEPLKDAETSETEEICSVNKYVLTKAIFTNDSSIEANTWVYVESKTSSGYKIKWYDDYIIIPTESVYDESFVSELPTDPSRLKTAGFITKCAESKLNVIPQQIDPNAMQTMYRQSFAYLKCPIVVRNGDDLDSIYEVPKGTLVLIWGELEDKIVVCWYEKYIIVPENQVEVCTTLPDWAEKKSAGFQFDPVKLPINDLHFTDRAKLPTKYAIVAKSTTAWVNGLPRKEVTIDDGTIIECFNMAESENRFFFKYGENDIAYIFKEDVNIIEKDKFSEEELVSGRFEGIITKKP